MKKKARRSFFEAFRAEPPSATVSDEAGLRRPVRTPKPRRSGTVAGGAPPGLTLGREALVLLIPALVILMVVSHVWGYKRGFEKGSEAAETGASAPPRVPDRADDARTNADARRDIETAGGPKEPPFWTVRIISGISMQSARSIRAELLAKGYDAFIYNEPRFHGYTVNVGRFESDQAPPLLALRQRLAAVYADCYPQRVSVKENILE
jgi:hypothetical protein